MKRLIILVFAFSLSLLAAQTESNLLSLQQAREIALQNNNDYQVKLAALNSAKWNKNMALSSFLPTVSLSGTWLYMDPATSVQTGMGSMTLNKDMRTIGLSLSQPLFVGGKLWQAYKMAEIGVEMAELALKNQEAVLYTEVENRYLSVLQAMDLVKMAELDYRSAEVNLEIALLKKEAGLLSSADYLRFEGRQASKEVTLLQARSALQLSQLNLKAYLDIDFLPVPEDVQPNGTQPQLNALDLYDSMRTQSLTSEALKISKESNVALQITDAGVDIARRSYQMSKGSFLPTLMLTGSRQYKENGIDRYKFSSADQIMLNVSIPLLPQLGNYSTLRKSFFELQKSTLEAETASTGIQIGVEAAVLNLVSGAKQVKAAKLALDYTQQSYELLQERFRMNLLSSAELLDAELMLSSARMAYSNSMYGFYKSRIALMQVLGINDEARLNEIIISGV